MNPGEILHYAVSAASAIICLYVRGEIREQRIQLDKEISNLRLEVEQQRSAIQRWVWANFRPRLVSQGQGE